MALALRCSNNTYLPLCRGLEGAIGALQVDPAHVPNPTEVPSEVRRLRRVGKDNGEQGEALHADAQESASGAMVGRLLFWQAGGWQIYLKI